MLTKNGVEIHGHIAPYNYKVEIKGEFFNMTDSGSIVDFYTSDDARLGISALTDIEARKLSNIEAVLSTSMDYILDKDSPIRDFLK